MAQLKSSQEVLNKVKSNLSKEKDIEKEINKLDKEANEDVNSGYKTSLVQPHIELSNKLREVNSLVSQLVLTSSSLHKEVKAYASSTRVVNSLLASQLMSLGHITSIISAFRADYIMSQNGKNINGEGYYNPNLISNSLIKGINTITDRSLKNILKDIRNVGNFANQMSNSVRTRVGNNNKASASDIGIINRLIGKFLPEDLQDSLGPVLSMFPSMFGIDDTNIKTLVSTIGDRFDSNFTKKYVNPLNQAVTDILNKNVGTGGIFKQFLAGKIADITGLGDAETKHKESNPKLVLSALAPFADDIKDLVEFKRDAFLKVPSILKTKALYATPVWVINSQYQKNGLEDKSSTKNEVDDTVNKIKNFIKGFSSNKKDENGNTLFHYDPITGEYEGILAERLINAVGLSNAPYEEREEVIRDIYSEALGELNNRHFDDISYVTSHEENGRTVRTRRSYNNRLLNELKNTNFSLLDAIANSAQGGLANVPVNLLFGGLQDIGGFKGVVPAAKADFQSLKGLGRTAISQIKDDIHNRRTIPGYAGGRKAKKSSNYRRRNVEVAVLHHGEKILNQAELALQEGIDKTVNILGYAINAVSSANILSKVKLLLFTKFINKEKIKPSDIKMNFNSLINNFTDGLGESSKSSKITFKTLLTSLKSALPTPEKEKKKQQRMTSDEYWGRSKAKPSSDNKEDENKEITENGEEEREQLREDAANEEIVERRKESLTLRLKQRAESIKQMALEKTGKLAKIAKIKAGKLKAWGLERKAKLSTMLIKTKGLVKRLGIKAKKTGKRLIRKLTKVGKRLVRRLIATQLASKIKMAGAVGKNVLTMIGSGAKAIITALKALPGVGKLASIAVSVAAIAAIGGSFLLFKNKLKKGTVPKEDADNVLNKLNQKGDKYRKESEDEAKEEIKDEEEAKKKETEERKRKFKEIKQKVLSNVNKIFGSRRKVFINEQNQIIDAKTGEVINKEDGSPLLKTDEEFINNKGRYVLATKISELGSEVRTKFKDTIKSTFENVKEKTDSLFDYLDDTMIKNLSKAADSSLGTKALRNPTEFANFLFSIGNGVNSMGLMNASSSVLGTLNTASQVASNGFAELFGSGFKKTLRTSDIGNEKNNYSENAKLAYSQMKQTENSNNLITSFARGLGLATIESNGKGLFTSDLAKQYLGEAFTNSSNGTTSSTATTSNNDSFIGPKKDDLANEYKKQAETDKELTVQSYINSKMNAIKSSNNKTEKVNNYSNLYNSLKSSSLLKEMSDEDQNKLLKSINDELNKAKTGLGKHRRFGLNGLGSDASFIEASNYALNKNYKEKNGGTYPTFFKDYLNKSDIDVKNTSSNNTIKKQLMNGNPVLLMGKDSNETGRTPFGSEPHYVVATGYDGRNIYIEDSESRTGQDVYNADTVLSHSNVKMSTNSKSNNTTKPSRTVSVASNKFVNPPSRLSKSVKHPSGSTANTPKSGRGHRFFKSTAKYGKGVVYSKNCWTGDSRTEQMHNYFPDLEVYATKGGQTISYFESHYNEISNKEGYNIFCWYGVNGATTQGADKTAAAYNKLAADLKGKSQVYVGTIGPCPNGTGSGLVDGGAKQSLDALNKSIIEFNARLLSKLSSDVKVIDVYSFIKDLESKMSPSMMTKDNLHYTKECSEKIREFVNQQIGTGGTSVSNTSTATASSNAGFLGNVNFKLSGYADAKDIFSKYLNGQKGIWEEYFDSLNGNNEGNSVVDSSSEGSMESGNTSSATPSINNNSNTINNSIINNNINNNGNNNTINNILNNAPNTENTSSLINGDDSISEIYNKGNATYVVNNIEFNEKANIKEILEYFKELNNIQDDSLEVLEVIYNKLLKRKGRPTVNHPFKNVNFGLKTKNGMAFNF